ncbi:MAG: DUF1684 domain-containing protein [Pyrinomonadaceae bacterium]|nr:DUF1684 domain-containing protein [Pyrinomonadaceae bacterium]
MKTFRDGRDAEFRNKTESPLSESDFEMFDGLDYFPVDQKFRVQAKFEKSSGEEVIKMPTSSGTEKTFRKFGVLKFEIDGKPLELTAFQLDPESLRSIPEYADLLFIPFKDQTNGDETYGGGRYIDIKIPDGDSAVIDLNLAYNPSCAYGTNRYNCPIPPVENHLPAAVRAGEKAFLSPSAAKSE